MPHQSKLSASRRRPYEEQPHKMRAALILSVIANLVLAAVMLVNHLGDTPSTKQPVPSQSATCLVLKGDLDFFIEGLDKNNDPFFSPLALRTMSGLLATCFPEHKTRINSTLFQLRNHLVYLVAHNASTEQKRIAHDAALGLFRQLRQLWQAST